MAKDHIRSTLEELGLSDKEAVVYLLLLQLGSSAASTVSDRSGLPRSTVQFTCQQLTKKGFLRMIQRGNAYVFTAEAPETLEFLLRKQREELESKEDKLHRILGELKAMQNPYSVLPKVQFFEGRQAMINGYQHAVDTMNDGDEILSYLYLLEEAEDEFDLVKPLADITRQMEDKRVRNRIISPHSASSVKWKQHDTDLRETRLVSEVDSMAPTEIMIFHNSMFAISVKDNQLFAYLVTNAAITAMHRFAFEELWKRLT